MAKPPQEVYHCPSCGGLTPGGVGEQGERVCAECGYEFRPQIRIAPRGAVQHTVSHGGFVQRDVSARRRQSERVEAVLPVDALSGEIALEEGSSGGRGTKEEVVSDDGNKKVVRRTKKRRRTRVAPLIFLCGWAIVVMLVVIVVRYYTGDETAPEEARRELEEKKLLAKKMRMDAFLEEHHASCRNVLNEFLATHSATVRTQFVRDSRRLAPMMSDYYRETLPWTLPEGGSLTTRGLNLFIRGENKAIEMVVAVVGTGEKEADRQVAFVHQGNRWVVEWESFVKYSTDPWPLFIEQNGEQEGVFRVYMRQRPVAHETARPEIKVQFLHPGDEELMWEQKSDWVVVPLNSENGRRIETILKQAEKEWEMGDSIFPKLDPKGLYRARVVLAWEQDEEGRSFLNLKEVQAGNWYGPGFEESFESPAGADESLPDGGDAEESPVNPEADR